MEVTRIYDIKTDEYPVFESMLQSPLIRFSKWECAAYWEKKGVKYHEAMKLYEKYIELINKLTVRR